MVGPGQGRDGVITCRIQTSFGVEAEDSRATGALAVRQVQVTDAAEGPTGLLPTLQQGPANLPQHLHAMGTASSPAPTSPPSTPPVWDQVATGVEPLALAEALSTACPPHPTPPRPLCSRTGLPKGAGWASAWRSPKDWAMLGLGRGCRQQGQAGTAQGSSRGGHLCSHRRNR